MYRKQIKIRRATITFVTIGILLMAAFVLAMKPTAAKNPNKPDNIIWQPPLSLTDEFKANRYVVIKFLIQNETGSYLWDKSVRVSVVDKIYKIKYQAEYKPGGNGKGNVRIVTNRFYMTLWHPSGNGGQYTIYVTFDDWPGVQFSKTVYVT